MMRYHYCGKVITKQSLGWAFLVSNFKKWCTEHDATSASQDWLRPTLMGAQEHEWKIEHTKYVHVLGVQKFDPPYQSMRMRM